MKIKIFQLKAERYNIEKNTRKIVECINKAYGEKADIVCFPECALTGYPLEDRLFFEELPMQIREKIDFILNESIELKGLYIILPTPFYENGLLYNSALVILEGKIIIRSDKNILPNYGVFDEKRYFTSGKSPVLLEIKGKKVLIPICEDIWNEDYTNKALKLCPDMVICPNGSPFEKKKMEKRLFYARKISCKKFIYVNQVAARDELIFDGRSFVLEKNGEVSLLLKSFEEDEALITFEPTDNTIKIPQENEEIIYKAMVFGLKEYLLQNGFKGVVIGLSGGIDSALAAKISADAVSPENVDCIFLPSEISGEKSRSDAKEFTKMNGLSFREISIEGIYREAKKACLPKEDITIQNVQSRCRALILMTISNDTGKMMVATGNKSEGAIGYCTLYGDTNGGYNPVKDIYKTEVYSICRFLNEKRHVFPEGILSKAPSAELKAGQTDETSFGLPYEVLDFILEKRIEEKLSQASIVNLGESVNIFEKSHSFRKENNLPPLTSEEIVEKVWDMVKKAQYKRMQSPPGAKVSVCAFGRDWRFGNNL